MKWDANRDEGGFIRKEGSDTVFAEMKGPGVIWRIWAAAATEGHVKIYLDGAAEPAVDLPFIKYFDKTEFPFQGKSLCQDTASGRNCYVPISFQKSCKIVAEEGWGKYYHFNWTAYPKDTILPTFKRDLSDAERQALAKADAFLDKGRGNDPAGTRIGEKQEEKAMKTIEV